MTARATSIVLMLLAVGLVTTGAAASITTGSQALDRTMQDEHDRYVVPTNAAMIVPEGEVSPIFRIEVAEIRTARQVREERIEQERRAAEEQERIEQERRAAEEQERVAAEQAAAEQRTQQLIDQGVVLSEEGWVRPAAGPFVSSYGPRVDPLGSGETLFHHGIDIAAPAGTPILAAGDGLVVYVGDGNGNGTLGLSGWVVVLQHADDTYTSYNHMYADGVLVEEGQEVLHGEQIAEVGSAGNSTGPHLHFSTWTHLDRDGHVDPVAYMAERGISLG